MADGKDSAVLPMKNAVNRMSQQRTYFQETEVSLCQSLSHTALYTGLSAMTEKERRRRGKKTAKDKTSPLLSVSWDLKLLLTI